MNFLRDVTRDNTRDFNLFAYPFAKWRWVSFDECDLKHNIHIYVHHQPTQELVAWRRFTSETCLGKFAKTILDSNFTFNDPVLKGDFERIKQIYEHFDIKQFFNLEKPFAFIGHDENEPFMIVDGIHRLTALFILQIIEGRKIVEMPIKWALCGIWQSRMGDFGRIPKNLCPDTLQG